MEQNPTYFKLLAAAYVRGEAIRAYKNDDLICSLDAEIHSRLFLIPKTLLESPLRELDENDIETILQLGKQAGLKLYRFKNTHTELPRIKHVLGFLCSIQPESLLDVGSGRGAFLWPCLNQFPHIEMTSIDILAYRVGFLQTVTLGGLENLHAIQANICTLEEPNSLYDIVTMLEVLEHIPNVKEAVSRAVRATRRYVVVTVPSKWDNNPEHIHLLTSEKLTELFMEAGCSRLHIDGVPGHLIMIASKEKTA